MVQPLLRDLADAPCGCDLGAAAPLAGRQVRVSTNL